MKTYMQMCTASYGNTSNVQSCWVKKQNVGSKHTVENHWASEQWSPDTHAITWMSHERALRKRSQRQRPQIVGFQFHETIQKGNYGETESKWWLSGTEAWRWLEFVLGVMKMSQKWIVAVAHNSMNTPRTIQSQGKQTMTCVCLLMGLENPRGDEAAATELALVRFLPRVWSYMLLQVAGLLKAFMAILASVTQRKAQAPWTHSTSEMLPLRWKQAWGPPNHRTVVRN